MSKITSLHARQILNSRGFPTVEVDCTLDDGSVGRAAVPSGVSSGTYEAHELIDHREGFYGGTSVLKAVSNVNTGIADALKGMSASDQRTLDQVLLDLDGTKNKANIGANAILGTSMAIAKARAASERTSLSQSLAKQYDITHANLLPVPMVVVIEAGKHSDGGLAFQEFMIMPTQFSVFSEALRAASEVYQVLKMMLTKDGHVTAVGEEGAFAPRLDRSDEAFSYIMKAIEEAGYAGKIDLAIDAAASEFHRDGTYHVDGKKFTSRELVDFYEELLEKYPLVSLEDSHSEGDWDGFRVMRERMGDRLQLVGDDLLVTNPERIQRAIERNAVNAVLIKLNQIGTVSETVDAVLLTQAQGWHAIVSHRAGDTEDTFMAAFAVAVGSGQIKTSVCRGERTAKYNELLGIEEELGYKAEYRSPFNVPRQARS